MAPDFSLPSSSSGVGDGDPAVTTVFDGGRATVRRLRKTKLVVVSGPDVVERGRASPGKGTRRRLALDRTRDTADPGPAVQRATTGRSRYP